MIRDAAMPYATKMQFRIGVEAGFIKMGRRRQKLLRVWNGEDVAYWDLRKLQVAGLVERVGGSCRLTAQGRWAAMACALGIPMTGMYMMADMYVAYCTWKERGTTGAFPIEQTRAKLDAFLEPQTIYNQTCNLRRLGMIRKVSNGLYTITRHGASRLSQHHKDVCEMHEHMRKRL